jgi:hypothetical protein
MRLSDLTAWLIGRFSRERIDRELDEEIDHHLRLETDRQLREGHDVETARRRALEKFGDRHRIAQATRDERATSLLEETRQDVRLAVRVLRRQASFTTLALVTLAIGIGTSTAAFALLDSVLLRPLPFAEPNRLVMIRELNAERKDIPPSFPNFVDWRERARSFSDVIAALLPNPRTIIVGGETLRVDVMGVSRDFFRTLGVTPVIGREFARDENVRGGPALVMVSHKFWTEQLGGRRVLGSLRIGDRTAEIVGVLPPSLPLFDDADLFVPNEQNPNMGRAMRER